MTGPKALRAWRVLLIVLLVAVSYLALTPRPPEDLDLGWDKLNHIAAFTALAFTASMAHPESARLRLWWLVTLLAFGGLIEIVQLFVPGRSGDLPDLLGDAIGVALGAAIAAAVLRSAISRPPRVTP